MFSVFNHHRQLAAEYERANAQHRPPRPTFLPSPGDGVFSFRAPHQHRIINSMIQALQDGSFGKGPLAEVEIELSHRRTFWAGIETDTTNVGKSAREYHPPQWFFGGTSFNKPIKLVAGTTQYDPYQGGFWASVDASDPYGEEYNTFNSFSEGHNIHSADISPLSMPEPSLPAPEDWKVAPNTANHESNMEPLDLGPSMLQGESEGESYEVEAAIHRRSTDEDVSPRPLKRARKGEHLTEKEDYSQIDAELLAMVDKVTEDDDEEEEHDDDDLLSHEPDTMRKDFAAQDELAAAEEQEYLTDLARRKEASALFAAEMKDVAERIAALEDAALAGYQLREELAESYAADIAAAEEEGLADEQLRAELAASYSDVEDQLTEFKPRMPFQEFAERYAAYYAACDDVEKDDETIDGQTLDEILALFPKPGGDDE